MPGIGPNACVHLVAADSRAALALVGLDMIENLIFVILLLFAIKNASLINMCASLSNGISVVGCSSSSRCVPAAADALPEHCSVDV